MRQIAALQLLVLCSLGGFAQAQSSHYPMSVGSRWELKSGGTSMKLEVESVNNGVYRVRWDNPWVKATFGFRPQATKVDLAWLDMGSGVANMPEGTTYFDFSQAKNKSWSNVLGTMTILNTGVTVDTPAGRFDNCIDIRARDTKKSDTFWTFAPGVGPVRFGQGKGAFLLTARTQGNQSNAAPAPAPTAPAAQTSDGRRQTTTVSQARNTGGPIRTYIGMDANPSPNEGYSDDAKRKRMQMAADGGATMIYIHPKWNELEPSEGKYNFDEVDFKTTLADQHNLAASLNIRVLDTNNRSMPNAYSKWAFDDNRTITKLNDLLERVAPRTKGRVQWIAIGNEVNEYLKDHRGEVKNYANMIRAVLPTVRRLFPNAKFTVNLTFFAVTNMRDWEPITSQLDLYSFTYYPLNADLTFRNPSVAQDDIRQMNQAAGGKPWVLQEIGYASSGKLHSSESTQAQFIHNAFAAFRATPTLEAANFVWMSDLPDSVVNDLTKYYKAAGSDNFREYLATLGYFDKNGKPKESWSAFQAEASEMKNARGGRR